MPGGGIEALGWGWHCLPVAECSSRTLARDAGLPAWRLSGPIVQHQAIGATPMVPFGLLFGSCRAGTVFCEGGVALEG